jgi:precorrin-4 methylase
MPVFFKYSTKKEYSMKKTIDDAILDQMKSSRQDRDSLIIIGQKLPDGYQKKLKQEKSRVVEKQTV